MLNIEIDNDTPEWLGFGPTLHDSLKDAVHKAVSATPYASLAQPGRSVEVSILLSNDAHIQKLNNAYRAKDKPTNILSFPGCDKEELQQGFNHQNRPPLILGDIIISYETVMSEAKDQSKPVLHHLLHLMVHGTLHLLDYDHINDDEAGMMENMERQILTGLGIKDPYTAIEDAIEEHAR